MKQYLLLFFIFCFGVDAIAQSECITAGAIYGSPNSNERGYCVVATTNNDGIYVVGFKDDSILLMEVNLKGIVLWSRTFDIVAQVEEHVFSMIIDSEGMLAGVGTAGDELLGGTVVAFRFDPNTLQMIWAHEYVGAFPRNYGEVIVQLEDGNFVIANNAVMSGGTNDLELLWLNKSTGDILPGFSKNYHLGASDRFDDMIYYDQFIYGIGRYTDGDPNSRMRHTLVKIDPTTGNHVWAKLGHVPSNQTARLYGQDIVIDQNEIYTNYYGDPVGTTTTNTKMYIQKSSIDGDLIWLKQYELPGTADACYELIKSGNGFVVFAGKRSAPSDLILFKIDAAGAVLWAKRYPFTNLTSPQVVRDGAAQMTEVGGMLVFTGYVTGDDGTTDLILVRTDLNGETNIPCVEDEDISIPVTAINNPTFYNRNITEFDVSVVEHNKSPEIIATTVSPVCAIDSCERHSCITAVGAIYGSPNSNERAKCLLPTAGNDGLYAIGMKEDSVLIVKLNLMGQISWARAFDIIPGVADNVSSAILDDEGMILIEGIAGDYTDGGNIFAFRYNPNSNQILWAREYVNNTLRSYTFPVTQTVNGDYLLGCNPHPPLPASDSDSELLQIDKTNGNPVVGLDKVYDLGGSDEFTELVLYQNFIYGCGRYTDGAPNSKMRHTLMKIDPATLNQVWVKCGHVAQDQTARLYARDILIDADMIYSVGLGDPVGTSSTNTIQYVQKTDINGNLIWINRYDLPGNNDWGHQIIKSGNGLVVLAGKADAPTDIFLYKTDLDGAMVWGKKFQFTLPSIAAIQVDRGNSQIIEVGSNLFLTATGVTTNGASDILIIRMDLDGNTDLPCVTSVPVSIPVLPITNPVFYNVYPTSTNASQTVNVETPEIIETPFTYREECVMVDTVFGFVDTIICSGNMYEGYSITGTYEDNFVTLAGCDSVRMLNLTVNNQIETSAWVSICSGASYLGYSTAGIYLDTFTSVTGCDSIQQLQLDVSDPALMLAVSICQGDTYFGYTQSGIYEDTLAGSFNTCDTLRQLTLTVLPIIQSIHSTSICTGQSFEGYTTTGTFVDTFQTSNGCDSVRILQLIVSDTIVTTSIVDICFGQSYEGYSAPGFYIDTFQSSFGCDSLRQLTLQNHLPEKQVKAQICAGQNYEQYSLTGTYFDTIPGIAGECDTIRELDLVVLAAPVASINQVICDGETFLGYSQSGVYIDTLSNSSGCDSIRELHLKTLNPINRTIQASICEQVLTNYHQPGVYTDTFVSYRGCDSIVHFVIDDTELYIPNVFSPNADGINDVFTVFPYPGTELGIEYFAIFDRLGDMVYETKEWPIVWSGQDQDGKPCHPAVFAYLFIYHCGNQQVVKHGNVTLVL